MARRKKASVGKVAAKKGTKAASLPVPQARPGITVAGRPSVTVEGQVIHQAQPEMLIPVQAPAFSASALHIQATGNDFLLVFQRPTPIQGPQGLDATRAMNVPAAVITVSPQSAKDFSLLFATVVAKHEAKFGKILTPYMERLAASGKKARKAKKK